MAHVAADNDICAACGGQRQVLVVFGVPALLHGLGRFDPFGREHDDIEDSPATLEGDEGIELRAEDD
ncbi:MAG: hypothetical protein M0002_16525 [Rhodospirillales bacterium]|nr:hypothetical protein [Rhodospirillales bacterium]